MCGSNHIRTFCINASMHQCINASMHQCINNLWDSSWPGPSYSTILDRVLTPEKDVPMSPIISVDTCGSNHIRTFCINASIIPGIVLGQERATVQN